MDEKEPRKIKIAPFDPNLWMPGDTLVCQVKGYSNSRDDFTFGPQYGDEVTYMGAFVILGSVFLILDGYDSDDPLRVYPREDFKKIDRDFTKRLIRSL